MIIHENLAYIGAIREELIKYDEAQLPSEPILPILLPGP